MVKTGHGFFQDVSLLTSDVKITLELLDSGFLFGQGRFPFAGEDGTAFGFVLLVLTYPAVQ